MNRGGGRVTGPGSVHGDPTGSVHAERPLSAPLAVAIDDTAPRALVADPTWLASATPQLVADSLPMLQETLGKQEVQRLVHQVGRPVMVKRSPVDEVKGALVRETKGKYPWSDSTRTKGDFEAAFGVL